MGITVNTNVSSLNAQRALNATQQRLTGNLGRLSTGMRINTAADDAAGLGISERMKSQIRSYAQAERNSQDGISLLQTAEGAMNEISGVLVRMRELAVQASNGTLGATERGYLGTEATALTAEVDRIASSTQFNGINLLDGTYNRELQVGIGTTVGTDTINVTVANTNMATLTGGATIDLATSDTTARASITGIDAAITALSGQRSNLGAVQNRLNVTISNLGAARENTSAANSRIRDVDVASESADMTRNNILMQAGVSVLAQANSAPQVALNLLR